MKPTLLVMAAGLGSRYGGVKQIDPVGLHDEILLDYATYDAIQAGFGKVIYIIRPDIEKDFREKFFDRVARNIDAEYVFQTHDSLLTKVQIEASKERTKPWGTVHAVLCSKDVMKTPFAVINADDYYGREAFNILGEYLSNVDPDSTNHAMVGYLLKNTMSLQGTVSRGVCEVNDGFLVNMEENTKIGFDNNNIVSQMPEGDVLLTGEEVVSMNFFGFTPKIYDYMLDYFDRFMKENVSSPKAECLLPNCVGEAIQKKQGTLKVFSSPDSWFGMTYKEDRDTVKQNLALKTQQGFYPEFLWKN